MKNIYHRYIDIPFEMTKPKIFETPHNDLYMWLGSEYLDPTLSKWLDQFGLKTSNMVEAFYTGPHNSIEIFPHTDFDKPPGESDPVKLNFTWGADNSYTRWWSLKKDRKYKILHNTEIREDQLKEGIEDEMICEKVFTADYSDLDLVLEKKINKPSLLNVGQLHSTWNPTDQFRWTLSYALIEQSSNKILRFNKSLEIFKDIIYE